MAKHTGKSQSNSEDENLDKTNNKDEIQRSIAKKRLLVSSIVLASCLASIIVIGELYSR
tara:strand:- start:25 stop:201 length:177 start_codon:yes stop_codon:yes gene_type:complete